MFYFYYPPFGGGGGGGELNKWKTWAKVKIKALIFNLQYLRHFCMDLYATNMSRSTVKRLF